MTRPTCASVYSENPAKTSAMRENSFFSSALSESHGRTCVGRVRHATSGSGLIGVSFVPFGRTPFSIMRASTQVR